MNSPSGDSFEVMEQARRAHSMPQELGKAWIGSLHSHYQAMLQLSQLLWKCILLGLGGENTSTAFLDSCPRGVLRLNQYPPLPRTDHQTQAYLEKGCDGASLICGEHIDGCILTILYQDTVGGLQCKNKYGVWVDIEPIPGTFLGSTLLILLILSSLSFCLLTFFL